MFRIPGFPELLTLNLGQFRPSIRGYCSPRLVVVRMLSREADAIRAHCGSREFDDARQGPVKLGGIGKFEASGGGRRSSEYLQRYQVPFTRRETFYATS